MSKKAFNSASKFTLPCIDLNRGRKTYVSYLSDVLVSNDCNKSMMKENEFAIREAWSRKIKKMRSTLGYTWVNKKISEV